MKELKQLYLEGGYIEIGGVTLLFIMLIVAILSLIITLFQELTKIDFTYRFSKKGMIEFKQELKAFIVDWIPVMLMTIGLISIIITLTYILGFIIKLFI